MALNPKPSREAIGGTVVSVEADGAGASLGVKPGDRLLAINESPVRDLLDVMYHGVDEGDITLDVDREGQALRLQGESDGYLGLEFSALTFDGIRRCRNRCMFCFVDQLPRGMRSSLYIKDDDYRHSVFSGSFITLTNLKEADWARLEEQRLGPLRVSVHTTDHELRRRMLGNPQAPDILEQLDRLAALHIQIHCQVVLVPGVNDGHYLDKTIADLAARVPAVESVAVVPVGRTKHGERCGSRLREFTVAEARELVGKAQMWQREFRKSCGLGLVYLGDDFYLRAGCTAPSARSYDGFPQYENGVGMVRSFLDDWQRVKRKLLKTPRNYETALTAVCGQAFAPVLVDVFAQLAEVGGPRVSLVPVTNAFFGPTVTTSGLLTGQDVLDGLGDIPTSELGEIIVLPRTMLDTAGEVTLDNITPGDLEHRLERSVRFVGTVSEIMTLVAPS